MSLSKKPLFAHLTRNKKARFMFTATLQYSPAKSIQATIENMLLLERESVENHFFQNWVLNAFTFFTMRMSNQTEIYKRLHDYVVKNFTYRDESEVEILTSPKQMIIEKIGDCDDFALFIKAVLKVLGIESNYLLAGKENEDFSHVLVITKEGILIDGTNDKYNFLDKTIYTHTAVVEEN